MGRQPILDRRHRTLGFELLFRHNLEATSADFVDGDAATARVLINTLTELGLEPIIGTGVAFINVTGHYLEHPDLLEAVPAQKVIFELLEDVQPTAESMIGLMKLKSGGFRFAAGSFVCEDRYAPILEQIAYNKYRFAEHTPEELGAFIERDHAAGRKVVLEHIDQPEQAELGMELGADYFQGYYFARPTTLESKSLQPNAIAALDLLSQVTDPNASLMDIAEVLSHDVSLSVRTLRFVNSATYGLRSPVNSITQAATLVGRNQLRSWAGLALLASFSENPEELATMMLTRARACAEMAEFTHSVSPDMAYTVGMLSLVDVLTGTDMQTALGAMALGDEVRSALMGESGRLQNILQAVVQLERSDGSADIDPELARLYYDAVAWASKFRESASGAAR